MKSMQHTTFKQADSLLKRSLKGKMSITRALVISFLMTGLVSVGGQIVLANPRAMAIEIEHAINYRANGGDAQWVHLDYGYLDFRNGTLTTTEVGPDGVVKVNVVEGTLTPNTADGTVAGSATGVAKAADVAAAINNTNTVLTGKIDANTEKINDNATVIATNKADIVANKDKIVANTADIATNKADIAANKTAIADNAKAITNLGNNTFTLNGDSTSTTAQALNKNGGLSFKVAGDGTYISTAAAGDTVTVSLDEQAIKDTAKFKVKANNNTAADVSGGDTVSFNDGSNIEITQTGKDFTIATKQDVTFTSVKANTFTAGTNVLNATGLTLGNTTITTAGLTNGNTTITGTGVTTDAVTAGSVTATGAVTAGSATIGGKVNINNAGINAGNTVITNVASGGTTDTNAANIGDVKNAVANLSQNLTISDGTTDGTVDLKNQKLTVTGTGAATATVSGQSITVNVAEGTLTPNTADGTVAGSATGVAKAADVAAAINNTNTVLTGKIDANTEKINDNTTAIATNKADIAANKDKIATNTGDIAANKIAIADNKTAITNLGNNTFTLTGDGTSSTTAQALNKTGGLSFKVAGDGKYISTAAAGDTVTVSLNEQAIKDTAKSSVKFKVKANANAEEVVNADDTIAFNDGNNIEITQNGKAFTIGTKQDVTFNSVVANTFTAGTNVLDSNGLTIGGTRITNSGVDTNQLTVGAVTISNTGINAGGQKITNVAAGTADTDAVNVGQLRNMGSNTAMAITNLQRESQRIGAQSAAMAALKPIQYDPLEPTQIMAGVGNYRGETAGALGIAHYTNENTMFHIGATIGNENNMVNAGVTHKFGSSPEKGAIPDRYKAGPISSIYVMQTEMSQLQKENAEQKEVISAQQKSIDELKAAVVALLARG